GFGSCWIGWFDEKALKRELAVPKDKRVDIVIALGYPAEEKAPVKLRKFMEEISASNQYDCPI
ncbi:MAG TPA: nitroreductase family protein, partial [Candidatus Omnitrophota bacterium]|nr:nitroreductase family protein [Candidatus Omnitrophota bacterium]